MDVRDYCTWYWYGKVVLTTVVLCGVPVHLITYVEPPNVEESSRVESSRVTCLNAHHRATAASVGSNSAAERKETESTQVTRDGR